MLDDACNTLGKKQQQQQHTDKNKVWAELGPSFEADLEKNI